MVNNENIAAVLIEMKRLENTFNKLIEARNLNVAKESTINVMQSNTPYYCCPKEQGSVKRASMDLTRALAVLRSSKK